MRAADYIAIDVRPDLDACVLTRAAVYRLGPFGTAARLLKRWGAA